ncbi:MAG: LysM peptidoglycan-binding domain-containing protein [Candidatus Aureabacteria bacterium]|nr:LysM peptidoglycan-binding domain-containing protein [Candidatus Auribacterota bacterium]
MKVRNVLILGGVVIVTAFFDSGCIFKKKYRKVTVPVYQFGETTEKNSSNWQTEKQVYVEGVREYKVQPGDTLSNISRKFNVSVSDISDFNNIADPNRIRVGMYLQIPPSSMQKQEETSYSVDENNITHKVEPGETLWGIAQIYGVDVNTLMDTNSLSDTTLNTGQILYIPLK